MSPNNDQVVEATKLFIFQLRTRPENVIANCNALLEGSEFRLQLTRTQKEPATPAEASLYDHLTFEDEVFAFPFNTAEKGVAVL